MRVRRTVSKTARTGRDHIFLRRCRLGSTVKLVVAALTVAAIGTAAHGQATLTVGNNEIVVEFPTLTGGGTGDGLTSLLRNNPFAAPVDHIEDIGNDGLQWFLGVDTNAGSEISALAGAGDNFSIVGGGSKVNYSYGSAGTTTVTGSYTLADPPGPTLDPQTDTTGNFHAAVFMNVNVVNNDSVSHTYNLYSFHDLALTNIQAPAPTGFAPNADERILISGTNSVAGVNNNLITQTNFDASHPLFSQATIRVINPGDSNGDLKVTLNPDIQTVLSNNATTVPGSLFVTLTTGLPAITPYEAYLGYGDVNLDGKITLNPDIQTVLTNNATERAQPSFVQAHEDNATLIDAFIKSAVDLNGVTVISPAGNQTGETLTSAFQWTFTLDPGESFSVDELLIVTPEPGSLGLMGLGAMLLLGRRRRR